MLKLRKNEEKGLNNEFMNILQKLQAKKLLLEPWCKIFSMNVILQYFSYAIIHYPTKNGGTRI